MRKVISIISVCLVIVILTTTLSACGEKKKFVGTWEQEGSSAVMVLASDGTGSITEDVMKGSVNWSLEDDKLQLTVSICGMSETTECTYEFSDDTMTLTGEDGSVQVYHKAD